MNTSAQTLNTSQSSATNIAKKPGRSQRGALSLELGLVLLIVAIIVAGAVMKYYENMRKNSISDNVEQLNFIGSNLVAKYGKQNLYSQATTANAVRSRIIPTELRDGDALTATNAFGSSITITPVNLTGTNDAVRIDWGNVPASQCSDIVSGTQGTFRMITVAGTAVKPLDSQLDMNLLETQCESSGTDGNIALQLSVGRS